MQKSTNGRKEANENSTARNSGSADCFGFASHRRSGPTMARVQELCPCGGCSGGYVILDRVVLTAPTSTAAEYTAAIITSALEARTVWSRKSMAVKVRRRRRLKRRGRGSTRPGWLVPLVVPAHASRQPGGGKVNRDPSTPFSAS